MSEDVIVSLDMVRRAARARDGRCKHTKFEVCEKTGTVYCRDCDAPVSAFYALVYVCKYQEKLVSKRNEVLAEIERLKAIRQYKPYLRAVKELERIWRSKHMLPICPHCKKGVEAKDMAATGKINRAYELRVNNEKTGDKATSSTQEKRKGDK